MGQENQVWKLGYWRCSLISVFHSSAEYQKVLLNTTPKKLCNSVVKLNKAILQPKTCIQIRRLKRWCGRKKCWQILMSFSFPDIVITPDNKRWLPPLMIEKRGKNAIPSEKLHLFEKSYNRLCYSRGISQFSSQICHCYGCTDLWEPKKSHCGPQSCIQINCSVARFCSTGQDPLFMCSMHLGVGNITC